jgi:hypothetical protein
MTETLLFDATPLDPNPFDRDAYVAQLQAIHGLRDALGLSDEAYRGLLERLTGVRSAKHMTAAQRERVISFLRLHQALDEAHERLEAARDLLSESAVPETNAALEKVVALDGRREVHTRASLEEIIETMRNQHGPEVRLVGARERRYGARTVLELSFERPVVLAMAG